MKSIDVIGEIPANAAGIKLFSEALVNSVMDGNVDPLDLKIRIDAVEKIVKAVKESTAFKDACLDQADLHAEKTFDHLGLTFTKAVTAKYDYSEDEVWADIKRQENLIAKQRKEREALLKTLPVAAEIDGQMAVPPVKHSTDYVKVTF